MPIIKRVLVVGPSGAGKSEILYKFKPTHFTKSKGHSQLFDVQESLLLFPEVNLRMEVVEIGGSEAIHTIPANVLLSTDAFILVYDVTDRNSFKEVVRWYELVCNKASLPFLSDIKGVLVANKVDMADARQVSYREGKLMADILLLRYFETSAITGHNIAEMFLYVANSIAS